MGRVRRRTMLVGAIVVEVCLLGAALYVGFRRITTRDDYCDTVFMRLYRRGSFAAGVRGQHACSGPLWARARIIIGLVLIFVVVLAYLLSPFLGQQARSEREMWKQAHAHDEQPGSSHD